MHHDVALRGRRAEPPVRTGLPALDRAVALLGSALAGGEEPRVTLLERAPELAIELAPDAAHASVTVLVDGAPTTASATGDDARRLDALQYDLREGPCLTALRDGEVVHAPELVGDARWTRLGARLARDSPVRSTLSLPLTTLGAARPVGSLNLSADRPEAFAATDRQLLQVYAAHVAALLAALRQPPAAAPERSDEALLRRAALGLEALRDGVLDVRLPPAPSAGGVRLRQAFDDLAEHLRTRQERLSRVVAELGEPLRSGLTVLDGAAGILTREQDRLSPGARRALELLVTELRWHSALSLQIAAAVRALGDDEELPEMPRRA